MLEIVGAVAGWAAGVGLAVLSALYVSQARDVKRLRERLRAWAGRAPERSGLGVSAAPGAQPVRRSRIGTRYVAVALVGLLVLGGAAASRVTQLTGGSESSGNGSRSKPKRSQVKPGNVTVAVLNGTMVPGLAARLRDQIGAAGFKKGMINDFSDKQLAKSVVQYAPGHQAEAKAVGRTVGVSRREPVTGDSLALAGDATVIVIAGANSAAVEPAAP